MIRLTIALLLISICCTSSARQVELQRKPMMMLCGLSSDVTTVADELNLMVIWKGLEDNGVIVRVWQDLKTKEFLISKTDSTRPVSCIISMGGKPGV